MGVFISDGEPRREPRRVCQAPVSMQAIISASFEVHVCVLSVYVFVCARVCVECVCIYVCVCMRVSASIVCVSVHCGAGVRSVAALKYTLLTLE